jgi:hypothetical protein
VDPVRSGKRAPGQLLSQVILFVSQHSSAKDRKGTAAGIAADPLKTFRRRL